MADYSELKKLAQSLNCAIERAQHKPGQWAETAQSMGGICCAGEPFQIGKPWAKEEPWAHFSFKRDSLLAVAAVNALPQLMALIAENEALKGPHDWLAEDLIKELVDNAQSFQDNSDHGESDPFAIVLLAAAARIRRQDGRIDQLKNENEQLAKTASCWDRLNIENKALSDSSRAERDQLMVENEVACMRIKELDLLFGRYILAMRSALIEEEHGKGPAAAMEWIYNSLAGPGELPPEGETDSQAYFDKQIVAVDDGMQEVMAFHESRRAAMGKGGQS